MRRVALADPRKHDARVAYYEQAIALGDLRAMRELAEAYREGPGDLAIDRARAVALYEQHAAASPGQVHPSLVHAAALLLNGGEGLPADPPRAASHLERLVASGDALAMSLLGVLLREGRTGVAKDEARAVALLERSVELGWGGASIPLAEMLFTGWGVAADPARARALLTRAVAEQVPGAQAALDSLGPP